MPDIMGRKGKTNFSLRKIFPEIQFRVSGVLQLIAAL